MFHGNFIITLIVVGIQGTLLPKLVKWPIVLYIWPVITLGYGGYQSFVGHTFIQGLSKIWVYMLLALIFLVIGLCGRAGEIEKNQTKVSAKEFKD